MKRLTLWIGIAAIFAVVGCKKSVPKVEGQDLKSATSKIEQSGFKLGSVNKIFTGASESGTVVSQTPAAATTLPKGSVVDLTIEESVTVPTLLGLDLMSARRAAAAQGLRVIAKNKSTKEAPAGTVLDQLPLPGRVPPGTQVEVLIAGEKGFLDTFVDADTRDGLEDVAKDAISNKLSQAVSDLLNGGHGNKDSHKKNGNGKGKVKPIEKDNEKGTGKGVGQILGDEADKQIEKGIDKGFDKGFDKDAAKDFGKDVGKDIAKDLGKGAARKFGEWFKGRGRNDSAEGGNETGSNSSQPLAAPAQLSPYQGASVTAVANRVNFAWSHVAGAASYTVEIETLSGKKWANLEKKNGLVETKYSAKVAARMARWRVRAVDSKQKDGQASDWAAFALVASGENVSTPVQQPKQHGPAQVVIR